MKIYSDYRSLSGVWYTFRPLNVLKREELSKRFNKLSNAESIKSQLILEEDGAVAWNIQQMLNLYGLSLEEFDIEELDTLFLEHILKVNFSELIYDDDKIKKVKEREDSEESKILAELISGAWGICDSAGDAIYMVEKLPADLFLSTLKERAADLERIYATEETKKKKATKKLKDELLAKTKESLKKKKIEKEN